MRKVKIGKYLKIKLKFLCFHLTDYELCKKKNRPKPNDLEVKCFLAFSIENLLVPELKVVQRLQVV